MNMRLPAIRFFKSICYFSLLIIGPQGCQQKAEVEARLAWNSPWDKTLDSLVVAWKCIDKRGHYRRNGSLSESWTWRIGNHTHLRSDGIRKSVCRISISAVDRIITPYIKRSITFRSGDRYGHRDRMAIWRPMGEKWDNFTQPWKQNQKSDVPGNMEGSGYALFKFDEGLTYKK